MEKGWLGVCLAAALIFIVLPLAQASLTVTGALCLAEVSPGQVFRHVIDVTINDSADPNEYFVEVIGMGQDLNGSVYELMPESDVSPYTARPFLNVTPVNFHLELNEHKEIVTEIMVPDDIGEGTRYAMVRIFSKPIGGTVVGISVAVDVPIMFYKKGSAFFRTGEITFLNWSRQSDQLDLLLFFKNTGNTHYKAIACADLRDAAGGLIAENSTALSIFSLLPTSTSIVHVGLTTGRALVPGTYCLNSSVLLENGTLLDARQTYLEIDPTEDLGLQEPLP
jgi:hypothetical protein